MGNETWKEVQLQDVAKELTVGYVGTMTSEYVDSGIPFLRSKNVEPFGIKWDDMRYIGRDFHEKLNKSSLSPGDVVIVRTGKPGASAVIPESLPEANCSDLVIIRPGSALDSRFLVYYLNSLASHHINSHLVGAVQQHFNVGSAKTLRLKLPALSEQKAIAHILSSLDDKIELNRQMNETLEAMARAIFKSWFVDFDPVSAKRSGRQPAGMDTATADLFPDEFEESSLGLIPKGWRVGKLGDYVEAVKGLSYKGKGLSDSGIPLHNLNSVYEGGSYKYEGIKYYVGEYKDRHIVYPGDVIVTNTEQGFKFLLIGYPAIVPKHYGSFGIFSHHIFRVRPLPDSPLTSNFIYLLLISPHFRDQVIGYTNGTTVNMLSADGLKSPLLAVPPHEIVEKFDKIVSFLLEKKEQNYEESQSLIEVRDTLLPKLMSGEIRVKEAEKDLIQKIQTGGTL